MDFYHYHRSAGRAQWMDTVLYVDSFICKLIGLPVMMKKRIVNACYVDATWQMIYCNEPYSLGPVGS